MYKRQAYDIALMSRELILNHPSIREYTTIWMDSIRNGAFGLTNTNRLIRFYQGATGLKTGSTDSALYCMSATAERTHREHGRRIPRVECTERTDSQSH